MSSMSGAELWISVEVAKISPIQSHQNHLKLQQTVDDDVLGEYPDNWLEETPNVTYWEANSLK